MAKKVADFIYKTPIQFFKENRLDLCRVVGGATVTFDSGQEVQQ